MAKLLPEFPDQSFQQAFLEGTEREAQGYRIRVSELEAIGLVDGDPALDQAKLGLRNALAELERVGGTGQKKAATRPARAKETR